MTSRSAQAIQNNEVEVMLVNKELAQEIKDLSLKLKTSSLDVVSSAVELLKQALNKEIIIRDPNSGKESTITALTNIDK